MANKITPSQLRNVSGFIAERVDSNESEAIGARKLFDAYQAHCVERAVRSLDGRKFATAMAKLGFQKKRHSCGFSYGGLTIKPSASEAAPAAEATTTNRAGKLEPAATVTLSTGLVQWLLSGLDDAQKAAGKLAAISAAAMTTRDLEYDLGQANVDEFFRYHFVDRDNLATLRDVTRTASEITSLKRELRTALGKAGIAQQPEPLPFQPAHLF